MNEVFVFGGSAHVYNGGWRDLLGEYTEVKAALSAADGFDTDWQQVVVDREICYERFRHIYDPFEHRKANEDAIKTLDHIAEATWIAREGLLRVLARGETL